MKASLAGRELHRRLHPHPRVTAVAKNTATAAPLALRYENAHSVEGSNLLALRACSAYPFSARAGWAEGPSNTPATERARDLRKGVKQGHPPYFGFRVIFAAKNRRLRSHFS